MLYTLTPPTRQGDALHLYPTRQAALDHAMERQVIHGVAVDLDENRGCLVPAVKPPWGLDAGWTTSVERHADGSMTARGPLPEILFVN